MVQLIARPFRVLAAALCLASLGAPATAGRISQSTEYFKVRGDSLAEIDRSLSQSGPILGGSGQRHPGATSVRFDGEVGYRRVPRGCEVAETDIHLELKTTLPRWVRRKTAEPHASIVWRTLADDIARHEKQHSEIAINYLKRLESVLRNLRPEPTCRQMEEKANRVMERYLAWHERAQREFDIVEGREIDMRLRKALLRNLREASAEPSP
ncbi:DUF922 domain-containing protein [Fulvimarina endophytica]|uniref:DUF922 domain-containing protein n=1 Tax=Fulvimarina endophytica TaxID=2293836 RepID=A0A371X810_9HYPH|nr:DUF922 domain-containing protein [Fulvimarina endophytica]RFC65379.1 DUF922 domain-containing protein [Fulvimarina endophytica]